MLTLIKGQKFSRKKYTLTCVNCFDVIHTCKLNSGLCAGRLTEQTKKARFCNPLLSTTIIRYFIYL
jgi:hypothetical protein